MIQNDTWTLDAHSPHVTLEVFARIPNGISLAQNCSEWARFSPKKSESIEFPIASWLSQVAWELWDMSTKQSDTGTGTMMPQSHKYDKRFVLFKCRLWAGFMYVWRSHFRSFQGERGIKRNQIPYWWNLIGRWRPLVGIDPNKRQGG